jgi:hypothetical protein
VHLTSLLWLCAHSHVTRLVTLTCDVESRWCRVRGPACVYRQRSLPVYCPQPPPVSCSSLAASHIAHSSRHAYSAPVSCSSSSYDKLALDRALLESAVAWQASRTQTPIFPVLNDKAVRRCRGLLSRNGATARRRPFPNSLLVIPMSLATCARQCTAADGDNIFTYREAYEAYYADSRCG